MNCDTFNKKMYCLFDEQISLTEKEELMSHIESCSKCKQEYDEINTMLRKIKPTMQIQASINLKSSIMNEIKNSENKSRFTLLKSKWSKVAAVASVILFALFFVPLLNSKKADFSTDASAAEALLSKSITSLQQLKSLYAEFKIRTLDGDNFELIDVNSDFVKHYLWKKSNPEKWKIQKPGRTVLNDGVNQYLYVNNKLSLKLPLTTNLIDWLKILLNPNQIMEAEKKMAQTQKADYKIEKKDNTTVLTIKAKALGNYQNSDYMLNSSVIESNNTRVYSFDDVTNRLISMQVFIEKDNKSYLIFDLTDIKYDEDISENVFTINLPSGMVWKDKTEPEPIQSEEFKNMNSEGIAKMFFESLSNLDFKTMSMVAPEISDIISKNEDSKNEFKNLKIISIGKSFKSGLYPGEFVPYEIKFKNGETKKMNLAVRNDNKNKAWKVDGGI